MPVSISYEFDPCDRDKALRVGGNWKQTGSATKKAEHEDIRSITQGIVGHKGRIHLEFGQPLRAVTLPIQQSHCR